ncbi:amidohydrolase family protein [Microlunatus elymi]|uniref:amidohydrolase family protein n=1 Tax=Microlunatus elymi TaxID=2596828 RepID=UPI003899546D
MQVPDCAARELERAVTQLGLRGALINAHTQGRNLDDRCFDVLWERAESLGCRSTSIRQTDAYLRRNLWVTTSGVCDEPPLRCAIDALGADRVLFATDYPFESIQVATQFPRRWPSRRPSGTDRTRQRRAVAGDTRGRLRTTREGHEPRPQRAYRSRSGRRAGCQTSR